MSKVLKVLLPMITLLVFASLGFGTTICTEDPSNGCVTHITSGAVDLIVASDGENPFDPFGAGYDTTDGIDFTNYTSGFIYDGPAGWVQIAGGQWVLPSNLVAIGCGAENETTC